MVPAISQEVWGVVGTITASQAMPTTDKSYATVKAYGTTKLALLRSSDGSVAQNVRFRGTATDANSNVIELIGMRGEADHFTRIATLTLTTGTQIYSSGVLFVDTIVVTNEKWIDAIAVVSPAGNDIAHIAFNTHGWRYFGFIASTLNSTSVIVEAARE